MGTNRCGGEMKKVDRYECEICGNVYSTPDAANECEAQGMPVYAENERIGGTIVVGTESGGFGNHFVYTSHEALILERIPDHIPHLIVTDEYHSGDNIHLQSLPFGLNPSARRALKDENDMWQSTLEMHIEYKTRESYHDVLIPAMRAAGLGTDRVEQQALITPEEMTSIMQEIDEMKANA